MATTALDRVVKNGLCSGCGACAAISGGSIQMRVESPGYNRPVVQGPVPEGVDDAIDKICPGSTLATWKGEAPIHPLWGPHLDVMTGHSTDPNLRYKASSGGMISALLQFGLETGEFDGVVQIKQDPADPTRNTHSISTNKDEIISASGSRYCPSSPLEGLGALEFDERRFAFVGKPCDASALRQMAARDPSVAARFPIILSFFCGGIPSHAGTGLILDDLGVDKGELSDFRYRGDGWPGFATATRKDGSTSRMSYMESWGKRLSHHVQFRCKICPDAVGGVADIACADAWYGDEKGYPILEEAEGRSLIIARTAQGKKLLDAAIKSGAVAVAPCGIEEIIKMQPSQAWRKRLTISRFAALLLFLHPRPRAVGVAIWEAARMAGVGESIKSFLGLIRRIVQGRK